MRRALGALVLLVWAVQLLSWEPATTCAPTIDVPCHAAP